MKGVVIMEIGTFSHNFLNLCEFLILSLVVLKLMFAVSNIFSSIEPDCQKN